MQADVAGRPGITQPAYAKQENSSTLRPRIQEKIAAVPGLPPEQLDF